MKVKPEGGIHSMLLVKDEAGNEYYCPADALRSARSVREEEKAYCETKKSSG